ncbi:NAD(P)-dependent oxidoreductase [Microbacterium immunditiarum]|uniref:Phosphoglycerate dehydrogenase-like enzyme n=1 Tax=Microbacterium immunditiarum TaxID=337480 RepID=A0A7Y9KK27_9MICO|nr:NAD(P)-dependent oxidoreductase [Microbacterium immunditiarum]NYE18399.1 phosphoglycerate dehydrogenase-like enzyme [Microbacterium immunditiarum]
MRVSVPTEELAHRLSGSADVAVWDLVGAAPWSAIDIVVPPYQSDPSLLAVLADVEVRLVQSQSIGFDGVADHLPPGIAFANAAGVHEAPAAEIGLALLLAAQRDLPRYVSQQATGTWGGDVTRGLLGLRVVVLGAGGLAGAFVDRLAPFGAEAVRVGRSARRDARGDVAGPDDLARRLPEADAVVVCLPLDDSTRGLVDASFLGRLSDGALVVNIGRGAVVDTAALLLELEAGRLRAALDVTDPEPLPPSHPLWRMPGVLISPHVGGKVATMTDAVESLLRKQLAALGSGTTPTNLVDLS